MQNQMQTNLHALILKRLLLYFSRYRGSKHKPGKGVSRIQIEAKQGKVRMTRGPIIVVEGIEAAPLPRVTPHLSC